MINLIILILRLVKAILDTDSRIESVLYPLTKMDLEKLSVKLRLKELC